MKKLRLMVLATAAMLAGCGETTFETAQQILDRFRKSAATLYETPFNLSTCSPGTLTQAARQQALDTVNTLRKLHGLPLVSYDESSQPAVMQAALMMAVSGQLSHTPGTNWPCYTPAGATAAATGNLSGGATGLLSFQSIETDIIGWMTEVDNATPNNVGHRRWLLNPFLGRIAYGRVAGTYSATANTDASVMKVFGSASNPTTTMAPGIIAWPMGDYPARFFNTGALLSVSLLVDPGSAWANNTVDFGSAVVSVTGPDGQPLAIRDQSSDREGYGLPNNLQFRAQGIATGVTYQVTVRGVKVGSELRDLSYSFRLT